MSHHIVEAKNLKYSYPDGTAALEDISFRITHGESIAIVGENGAGKSTLLLHMIGYLLPTSGSLQIGDCKVSPETLSIIRRSVGMVFQDPDDQLFMPTVFDDVAFGPLNMGLPSETVKERVQTSLATVGMEHLAQRPPHKLSAGEKRSVAIAGVLAMSPDILILDEPSSHLDPKSRRRLINLLSKFEHTKIIATHDLDLALDLCTRTIVIHKGTVAMDGPTINIFNKKDILEKCSLEQPFSMQSCPACNKLRLIKTTA